MQQTQHNAPPSRRGGGGQRVAIAPFRDHRFPPLPSAAPGARRARPGPSPPAGARTGLPHLLPPQPPPPGSAALRARPASARLLPGAEGRGRRLPPAAAAGTRCRAAAGGVSRPVRSCPVPGMSGGGSRRRAGPSWHSTFSRFFSRSPAGEGAASRYGGTGAARSHLRARGTAGHSRAERGPGPCCDTGVWRAAGGSERSPRGARGGSGNSGVSGALRSGLTAAAGAAKGGLSWGSAAGLLLDAGAPCELHRAPPAPPGSAEPLWGGLGAARPAAPPPRSAPCGPGTASGAGLRGLCLCSLVSAHTQSFLLGWCKSGVNAA